MKRLKRFNLSMSTQMVLVMFIGIVIPSIIFFIFFVTKYTGDLLQQGIDERSILLEEANKNIQLQLEHYANSSMNLYYNSSLLEYINSEEYAEAPESVVDYLAMIINSQHYVEGVILCMGDNTFNAGKEFLNVDEFRKENEELVLKMKGRPIWLPTYVMNNYSKKRPDFVLARAVNSKTGQVGVFYMFVSTDIFDSVLTNDIFNGKESDYYIISEDGKIVTSNRQELVGTAPHLGFSDQLFEVGTGNFTYTDENGIKYVVVCAKQRGTGWISVTVTDCDIIYRGATAVKYAAFLFAGFDFLMLIVAYSMLHSFLILPLRRLEGGLSRVSEGKFSTLELPRGYTEIHLLTQSYNYMVTRMDELIADVRREEIEKNKERLKVLSMHVGPHFLYNTLNTIKWMAVLNNQASIKQVVESLMKLMAAVTYSTKDNITLEEEISLLNSYVYIQRVRFMNFQIEYDIPEELLTLQIGRFLLQPLVENCILHGFRNLDHEGIIKVTARKSEKLCITVSDNGSGFDPALLSASGGVKSKYDHVGLGNVTERIRLNYGPEYGLSVESSPGEGACITLLLPIIAGEEETK